MQHVDYHHRGREKRSKPSAEIAFRGHHDRLHERHAQYGTHREVEEKDRRPGRVFVYRQRPVGKKIRAILRDTFPDAEQIYTRRGYAGVEGTPDEYIIQQLEKAGLEAYIRYPELGAGISRGMEFR